MTLFDADPPQGPVARSVPAVSALEVDFPAAMIGRVAEQESWRKEVHRPATHTHKWWAQRLGTVFRGILASAVTTSANEAEQFYASTSRLDGLIVLDPFAGSGTTLVEAAKLGAGVIGFDINPVATLVQRQALARWNGAGLSDAFCAVERSCRAEIDRFHVTSSGETVLYYFWVAIASCPDCAAEVELFSNFIFSKHAYWKKHPDAKASCPECHDVLSITIGVDEKLNCLACGTISDLTGPVKGQKMTCSSGHTNRVVDSFSGTKPSYRLFAKMVLGSNGRKRYEPIDQFDLDLYAQAKQELAAAESDLILPTGELEDGYNTRQATRWGFTQWRDFFNDRQLLSLGLLGRSVQQLDCDPQHREALTALFSGVLEFNNLFCSFKGEGTGAVRHMFSHHILKPERVPLEAHPWGTSASSGSFSTLFKSRIQRALEYKTSPHDIVESEEGTRRVFGLSSPIDRNLSSIWTTSSSNPLTLVRNGSSAYTDLPSGSVDLIITDPPFMDNVHYSELADFFHAWLKCLVPYPGYPTDESTRHGQEVQSTDARDFEMAIAAVWQECARVLKDEGLLAFTFHQSKLEGWVHLMSALVSAELVVTSVQPVKAEMSTAAPKSGAKEPSNLDSIVVCRRLSGLGDPVLPDGAESAASVGFERLTELVRADLAVGTADCRSVIWGSVLGLGTHPKCKTPRDELVDDAGRLAEFYVDRLRELTGASTAM